MTTPDWNELTLSEDPAIELLTRLGYTEVPPETLEAERSSTKEAILTTRLERALLRLNPWLPRESLPAAIRLLTSVQATGLLEINKILHDRLTLGESLNVPLPDGQKSPQLRFIDFDAPRNNELIVARQYKVKGVHKHIIPDVTVFINGIPLAVVECKSPNLGEKWKADAIKQLTRYQEAKEEFRGVGAPQLFHTAQVLIGACGTDAVYGTTMTPERFYFEWKQTYPLEDDALATALAGLKQGLRQQERVLYSLLRPENLLDIVRNFVVFEADKGARVKKLCRYKQFIAVNRAIERINGDDGQNSEHRGGVVWHTQGSGKSLTMLWLALKLRREAALKNPGIVIVTDRTALDRQISGVFKACGHTVERADKVRTLHEMLRSPIGRTVTTTIQKFQELREELGSQPGEVQLESKSKNGGTRRERRQPFEVLSTADNLVVMVDEAHRSQYRALAANMRTALPNAAFLGFTGTPIDKKDKKTLDTFGAYIDTYTIQQAVADGATVPIHYEGRLSNLRVVGASLDALFERVFADHSEEERAKIKQRYANEQALALAPRRIETIALDIIEHFRTHIAENGFKAQLAVVNRDAAVAYYDAFQTLNGPSAAVVISGRHNDENKFRPHLRSDAELEALVANFCDDDDPKLLIVCDRLLTGFDAPVEQVLYVDKPLREHSLLQAIARTNRRYEDSKTYGLVVDYWGVSEELVEALKIFEPNDVRGALTPKSDELPRLETRHRAALAFFAQVADKDSLEACLQVLHADDVWAAFDEAFRAFARSMDMLYPSPLVRPFLGDLRWLGKIRAAAATLPGRGGPDLRACGEKVRKLIADAISAEPVAVLFEQAPLLSERFDAKLEALSSNAARASVVEHSLRHEIHVRLDEDPAYYGSLKARLEQIIADYEAGRIDEAKCLQLELAMRSELRGGGRQNAEALGLSERGFAIYGLLAQAGERTGAAADAGPSSADPNARRDLAAVVEDVVAELTRFVDWDKKDDVLKEMRMAVARRLRDAKAGIDRQQAKALAKEIVELAQKRSRAGS